MLGDGKEESVLALEFLTGQQCCRTRGSGSGRTTPSASTVAGSCSAAENLLLPGRNTSAGLARGGGRGYSGKDS